MLAVARKVRDLTMRIESLEQHSSDMRDRLAAIRQLQSDQAEILKRVEDQVPPSPFRALTAL